MYFLRTVKQQYGNRPKHIPMFSFLLHDDKPLQQRI
jgi:hypothetical protein